MCTVIDFKAKKFSRYTRIYDADLAPLVADRGPSISDSLARKYHKLFRYVFIVLLNQSQLVRRDLSGKIGQGKMTTDEITCFALK
jgi:hypothetical protein